MSRVMVLKLSEDLQPFIKGQETMMREPISCVKEVAIILYYLSDERHVAYGVPRQSVSKIVRKVAKPSIYILVRKNSYSINVQAICDCGCRFLDVVVKWPESVEDAGISSNSAAS